MVGVRILRGGARRCLRLLRAVRPGLPAPAADMPADALSVQRLRHAKLPAPMAIDPRGRPLRPVPMLWPTAFDDVCGNCPLLARRGRFGPHEACARTSAAWAAPTGAMPAIWPRSSTTSTPSTTAIRNSICATWIGSDGRPEASISSPAPTCWSTSSRRSSGRSRICGGC